MAAENKYLSNLRLPAPNSHTFEFAQELFVDFTGAAHNGAVASANYNLATADWFKAFDLPKGALVTEVGWTVTTEQGTVTFAISTESTAGGSFEIKAAAVMGATLTSVQVKQTVAEIISDTDGGYVKITGGAAGCVTAVVNFYIKGMLFKRLAA